MADNECCQSTGRLPAPGTGSWPLDNGHACSSRLRGRPGRLSATRSLIPICTTRSSTGWGLAERLGESIEGGLRATADRLPGFLSWAVWIGRTGFRSWGAAGAPPLFSVWPAPSRARPGPDLSILVAGGNCRTQTRASRCLHRLNADLRALEAVAAAAFLYPTDQIVVRGWRGGACCGAPHGSARR